jgi:hypothetical protein
MIDKQASKCEATLERLINMDVVGDAEAAVAPDTINTTAVESVAIKSVAAAARLAGKSNRGEPL